MMRYAIVSAAAMAGMLTTQAAQGQDEGTRCEAGQAPAMSLGISGIECSNCTLLNTDDPRGMRWEFRSEPVILGVDPDGPAAHKLRAGDVIVMIDGYLATTWEGGLRIARPEAGSTTELRIRREGRDLDVSVTPLAVCTALPAATSTPSSRAGAVYPSAAPLGIPSLPPPSLLGLSFRCSQCGVGVLDDSLRVWSFSEPPTVTAVEPDGPAARAGIRVGDRIVSVSGMAVTTKAGGQRFGAIRPGGAVVLGIRRNEAERSVTLEAGERTVRAVESRGIASTRDQEQPKTVRYSGRLGDTTVNVTGEPVVVTQTDTEIIIRSGDITVRLRRDTSRRR